MDKDEAGHDEAADSTGTVAKADRRTAGASQRAAHRRPKPGSRASDADRGTSTERAIAFCDGESEPLDPAQGQDLAEAIDAVAKRGGFVWIGLHDPDEAALRELADLFKLHPLAVADAVSGKQQPKVQMYDEHLFVVLWALVYPKLSEQFTIGQTFLFVRDGLIITVQRNGGADEMDFGAVLEATHADLDHGVLGAFYGIVNSVVAGYTEVADHIESELEGLEEQVFDRHARDNVRRIYRLRQQIGKAQRAVAGLSVSLETSREQLSDLTVGHEKIDPYFRDILSDLVGTNQLIGDQDRALDGVLASHENNEASRQNEDTRKISAIAALLSVPAVLAGLFGMNFQNLPGVDWQYGWETLVAVILIIDGVMFGSFKKRHWL